MSKLSDDIAKYASEYYEGHPSISDEAFDLLVEKLRSEEPDNPILNQVGWGYVVNNPLINKCNHLWDVSKFEGKVRDYTQVTIPKDRASISAKLDGGSICCYYKEGKLTSAVTRGDGSTGYDVTDKLKFLVPTELKADPKFSGMVRGEIVMKNDTFNQYYAQDYESARNLAIGLVKRNQVSIEELRRVDFVAYTVRGTNASKPINGKALVYDFLIRNEFNKVDEFTCDDWSDENFGKLIKSYTKYPIDGIVITDSLYDILDDGTAIPHQEVAYKTESESKLVTVTDITWNLTRTGLYYPRVWFNPVNLSGATVRKATAFNARYLKENNIGIGTKLIVRRSGEVIPDVVEVVTPTTCVLPEKCPDCGAALTYNGTHLICPNNQCSGKSFNSLVHWICNVGSVKGIGSVLIEDFIDTFDIKDVDDLYKKFDTYEPNLSKIPGVGGETILLLKEMLKWLKEPIDFNDFLIACNLKMIGGSSAQCLIDYMDFILNDTVNDQWVSKLYEIKGVNITGKDSICDNIDMIRRYATYIPVKKPVVEKVDSSTVKYVTITGSLSVTRNEFLERIKPYGYVEGSINKACYLITDNPNSTSSKATKARQLGVKMISESDFMTLITTN